MACCYIAASMIAFIIRSCDALDINLNLQYNESVKPQYDHDPSKGPVSQDRPDAINSRGATVLSLTGMTCAACVSAVEMALLELKGVNQALVNLPLQEVRVFHEDTIDAAKLINAVEAAGYGAKAGERPVAEKMQTLRNTEELSILRGSLGGLGFYSTLIFGLGKGIGILGWFPADSELRRLRDILLLALTVFAAQEHGRWIYSRAWLAARAFRTNMHSLITASTGLGLALSLTSIISGTGAQYYDSIIGILLVITVGRYMDLLSRRQAANTFLGLYSILDETSNVKLLRLNKRVPTSVARVGDEIEIEPYAIIPCDAYVVQGTSHANESIITGESLPKAKTVGDLLLAGSRNGPNRLEARVHQDQRGSFLSQLVSSIESAVTSKGTAQRYVDSVILSFVNMIFAISVMATALTYHSKRDCGLGQGPAAQYAAERMMSVLAAACPCAIGLATPCAVMAGIDVAWRNGILLLQGNETMEHARDIKHVVLDKTGTLTIGTPSVTRMAIAPGWEERMEELALAICMAEEGGIGGHPLASAVFRRMLPMCGESWAKMQADGSKETFGADSGRGVKCRFHIGDGKWRTVVVGSLDYMVEEKVQNLVGPLERGMTPEGSLVFAAIDGKLAASMVLQDTLKPDAKESIRALRSLGIEVSMLTGDNYYEARRVASELGISLAGAEATPDIKLQHIKRLQGNGQKVMMVGDGMNDGPSLAAADIGVMMAHGKKCMSSGGSVLILQADLQSLVDMLHICRRTMRQVSANLGWAVGYNTLAVGLALGLGEPFGIHISPSIAAAMMSFSSVSVTMSGVFLRAGLAKHLKRN